MNNSSDFFLSLMMKGDKATKKKNDENNFYGRC